MAKLLVILSLPYLALSINIDGFLALLPFVREEFILSRTQIGYYTTFLFTSAALLSIFTGNVVDKLGPKRGILIGISCVGTVMLFYGMSPTFGVLLGLAFLAGLGFSIVTPSVTKGIMIAVPLKKRAVSMGIMQSGLGVGAFAGASLLPVFAETLGWRTAIQFAAVFMLIVGVIVYKIYHEADSLTDNSQLKQEREKEQEKLPLKDSLLSLFENKQLLLVCALGTIFGASVGAINAHFTVFLSEDINMTRTMAGLAFGTYQVGGIFGRPVWGWFSDRVFEANRNKTLFTIGLFIGAMQLLFGLFINNPQLNLLVVYIFSFFLGCSAWGWLGVHFIAVGESAGEKQTGIAAGLMSLFMRIGVLASPPIFGFIADMRGNYESSWLVFGVTIISASFIFLLFIKKMAKGL